MSETAHPTDELTDVRTMAVIHSMYRRELRLAGGLVRAVHEGATARAALVADHLALVGDSLHRHHTLEDRMVWPLLLQRVPEELEPIVHLMESQHRTVDALQDEIAQLVPTWRDHAHAEDRDRLADLFERLYVHLVEHLDAEEQRLLPIAARAMSQSEWDELGEIGRAETPRRQLSLTFGMYAYDGDPAAVASMLAKAPAPVRVIVPFLARRAFARHARAVHGTATP